LLWESVLGRARGEKGRDKEKDLFLSACFLKREGKKNLDTTKEPVSPRVCFDTISSEGPGAALLGEM
jgi:hypothetical protein